jgi:hypothetical protein
MGWVGQVQTRQYMKAFTIASTRAADRRAGQHSADAGESYPGKVCGEPCPTGQRVAEDRCVLTALAAHPKKEPPPQSAPVVTTDWTTRTTVARAPLIDQGESAMSLAGPTGVAPPAPSLRRSPLHGNRYQTLTGSARRFLGSSTG